jgi:hypothetical protein
MPTSALVCCLLLAACVTSGQPAYKPPSGPTPRTPSGKVDFSGVWDKPYSADMTRVGGVGSESMELPFTEWGLTEWKSYHPEDGDYAGACLPFGLSRSVNTPEPMQIVQNEIYFTMLFEQNNWYTVVPIDGRKHRAIDPTWFGDSVGHWEGDTLVIDTVNFNGKTRLDTVGHPHSDQLRYIQKYSRPDLGHISWEVTIDDPKTYIKPWKNSRTFTLRPDWEMMEYSCEENNKSLWEGRIKIPKQ